MLLSLSFAPSENIHEHYADELMRAGVRVAPPRHVKHLAHLHTHGTVSLLQSYRNYPRDSFRLSGHAASLHVTRSYRDKQQKVSVSFQKQLWISGATLGAGTCRAVSLGGLHSLCMNRNFPYAKQTNCYTCMGLHC